MKVGFYCLLLFLLTGCVVNNFKTNTDYESLHRFKRILVVSKLTDSAPTYLNSWLTSFPDDYDVCVLDISKLAFGNPDSLISQKVLECKSGVMLTIDFDRNFTAGSGKYITAYNEFFVQMVSLPDRKPFWKAVTLNIRPRAVVNQLVTDAIIEGNVPRPAY